MSESVADILDRMEKEVSARVAELQLELEPLQAELARIRKARAAISGSTSALGIAPRTYETPRSPQVMGVLAFSPYREMTIKQLALKALTEHFDNGATANELLDYFHNDLGRKDVERESLSPQLSRLKKERKLTLIGKRWFLSQKDETPGEPTPSVSGGEDGTSLSIVSRDAPQSVFD